MYLEHSQVVRQGTLDPSCGSSNLPALTVNIIYYIIDQINILKLKKIYWSLRVIPYSKLLLHKFYLFFSIKCGICFLNIHIIEYFIINFEKIFITILIIYFSVKFSFFIS